MSAKENTSAGMATEEAQGVAQDVASIVCKHLQNHRLGQLDMKVVLERQLSNRQRTQKRVEAIPFRAGIMGNAVLRFVCHMQRLRQVNNHLPDSGYSAQVCEVRRSFPTRMQPTNYPPDAKAKADV